MAESDSVISTPAERQDGRTAKGTFAKGNTIGVDSQFPPGNMAHLEHSLRALSLPPELAHLAADVSEFIEACIVDEGGAGEIGARRKSLLAYRARLHRRVLQLDSMIELRGLVDKRGKLRVAWLQQLQSLINAAKGIDSLLGLERRAKRVPSLEAWVASLPRSEVAPPQDSHPSNAAPVTEETT